MCDNVRHEPLAPADRIAELEEQVGRLREELMEQWLDNHAEHCGSEWPHSERKERLCIWKMPSILEDTWPR